MGAVVFQPSVRFASVARARRDTPAGAPAPRPPAAAWQPSREAALRDAVAHALTSSRLPGSRLVLRLLVPAYRAGCRLRSGTRALARRRP
jgi:hypothetical protein